MELHHPTPMCNCCCLTTPNAGIASPGRQGPPALADRDQGAPGYRQAPHGCVSLLAKCIGNQSSGTAAIAVLRGRTQVLNSCPPRSKILLKEYRHLYLSEDRNLRVALLSAQAWIVMQPRHRLKSRFVVPRRRAQINIARERQGNARLPQRTDKLLPS